VPFGSFRYGHLIITVHASVTQRLPTAASMARRGLVERAGLAIRILLRRIDEADPDSFVVEDIGTHDDAYRRGPATRR